MGKKVRLGPWQWEEFPLKGAPGNMYVLQNLTFEVEQRYTGRVLDKKITFRISPDEFHPEKWRLDYNDFGMWVALTRDEYNTPQEAAVALDRYLKAKDQTMWSKSAHEALCIAAKLPKGHAERKAILRGLQATWKTAGREVADLVLPQREVLKLMTAMEQASDQQSSDLVYEVYNRIAERLDLPEAERQALNRLKGCIENVGRWDPALQRNNIFKAANLLGIRLPSGMFASGSFAKGTRVQMKSDHWTGIGTQAGTVARPGRDRILVKFDDGTLVDVDARALEPERHKTAAVVLEDLQPGDKVRHPWFVGLGQVTVERGKVMITWANGDVSHPARGSAMLRMLVRLPSTSASQKTALVPQYHNLLTDLVQHVDAMEGARKKHVDQANRILNTLAKPLAKDPVFEGPDSNKTLGGQQVIDDMRSSLTRFAEASDNLGQVYDELNTWFSRHGPK